MARTLVKGVNRAVYLKQYYQLCKPNVVALILFTALVGMLLAVPGVPDPARVFWALLGIGLASASAAAVNHVVDRKIDALMGRTHKRPLPTHALTMGEALGFALAVGAIAMLILYYLIDPLTALLTFLSLIGYAVVYTMYLKHATPQNIVIGGAAGAAPPMLGWCAMTGSCDAEALLLFLIIFTWTPPHFWALAIHREKEYAKAGVPMLPTTHGLAYTRLQVLLYTILLFLVTLLPYAVGLSGGFYLGGAVVLGLGFLVYAGQLYRNRLPGIAMKTFGYSIIYLTALFGFLLVDHYLPLLQSGS